MATWKRVVIQGDNAATVALATTDTVATLSDSFVFADTNDSNLIKRDAIADVIGLVAGANTVTGLTNTAGVLSIDMSLGSETPATADLVLAWDAENEHFYTSTVANIGAAGENTTYNVSTSTASAGIANIVLTGSDTTTDSVSITGDSGVVVSETSDQITVDIPDATNAATGIFRTQLSHTSLATATAAVAGKVLGKMGAGGALSDIIVRDQDNFASADDTSLATTESIKAYVDAEVLASGSGTVTNVIGGTNIGVTDGTDTPTINLDATISLTQVGGNSQTEGTSDTAGSNIAIVGGAGTGTGAGGDIIFKTATPGGTGTSVNSLVTAMTISDDQSVTIAGNLVVNGLTTTLDTANLLVEDTFIALNSGGTTNVDAGIVFTGAANKVFGWDQESGRFGVDYAGGNAAIAGGGFSPDAWISTVHSGASASGQTAALAQIGNIYTISGSEAGAGDIYIYS